MLQDGHYVGQQQDDQGYQSSLSSPNESQMKRSGSVFLEISFLPVCAHDSLAPTRWAQSQKLHNWNLLFRPPSNQKQLLTVQKAADPFSQSLPESLLGSLFSFYLKSGDLVIPILGAVKHFGGDLSDSIRSNASTRSKVFIQSFLKSLSSKFWALYFQGCVWPSDF